MEVRMKEDVIKELKKCKGLLLLHDEDPQTFEARVFFFFFFF